MSEPSKTAWEIGLQIATWWEREPIPDDSNGIELHAAKVAAALQAEMDRANQNQAAMATAVDDYKRVHREVAALTAERDALREALTEAEKLVAKDFVYVLPVSGGKCLDLIRAALADQPSPSMVPCKWCGRENCMGCLPEPTRGPVEEELLAAIRLAMEDRQCAHISDGPNEGCPCWYCVCGAAIANAERKQP